MKKDGKSFSEKSIYTILASGTLEDLIRSNEFTEGKKWVTAKELLRSARFAGEVVFVIFAPAVNIRKLTKLTHFAELDDVKITQGKDGKWSTTVTVSNLTEFRSPRPKKTSLRVCSTGKNLPWTHIRPYVVVYTPSLLTKKKVKK